MELEINEHPITAVLEITRLNERLLNDFITTLNNGVIITRFGIAKHVVIHFEHVHSRRFTTRSGYAEAVLALYIKTVVNACNERWKPDGVSVNFVLSKPLIYVGHMTATPFIAHGCQSVDQESDQECRVDCTTSAEQCTGGRIHD